MREIKFRGKRLVNDEWVYGFLIQYENGWFICNFIGDAYQYKVDPSTVGQFTGLKDKNGKEIYEGDIVYARCCEKYLEVYWDDIGCGGWWFAEKIYGDMCPVGKIDLDWLEVKGNIHDNPELLEGDEEK